MSKRKLIAVFIAVLMLVALLPVSALAHEGTHDEHDHSNIVQFIKVEIKSGNHGGIYSPAWQLAPSQGDTWTFTAEPDGGYVFDHWTYDGNEVAGAFSTSGAYGEILTVNISQKGSWSLFGGINYREYKAQAVFVPDTTVYNVTLNLGDGGKFVSNDSNTTVVNGQYNDTLDVPAFTENEGYDHIGWDDSLNFHSSRTINARYEYAVSFVGNDRVTITGTTPVWTVNHNAAAPSYTLAPGYRFNGWDRSLNGISGPCTITANPAVGQGTITLEHTSGGDLLFEDWVEDTYDEGESVRLADSIPVPNAGWLLRGWKVGDTDVMLPWDVTVIVSGDETYTAVFYDAERLKTTAGSNGSLVNPVDTWEYARGDRINLNELSDPMPNYGYMLDKWIETTIAGVYQRDVVLEGGEPIITIGDSNYFKALFKTAEYTVTYVDSQGEVLGSEVVFHGGSVTKTKDSFTYDAGERPVGAGWNAADGQNITSNKTIVVNTEYEVTFDLDGGTQTGGGELAQWVAYGADAQAPVFDVPTGMMFTGWDISPENITQAQAITALYEYIDYTLTINYLNRADGTPVAPAYTGTYHYEDPYSVTSPAILGYDVPSMAVVSGSMPNSNLTVDIYYVTHKFTLTYMQNDGALPTDLRQYRIFHKDSVSDMYPVTVGYRIAGTATIVTIGDIEFINSEANRFTNPFLFTTNPIDISPAGETCTIYWYDEDNAEWIQAGTKAASTLYQVTFDANTGAFSDSTAVKYDYAYVGGSVESPDLPAKEGYTFVGWDINGDDIIDAADDLNTDALYDGADIDEISVSANMTIKAIFKINTFEVKFFDYDGTQIGATQIIDWNTAAAAPANPNRVGHTFAGWDKVFDAVKENLDITAKYTIHKYLVTFADHGGAVLKTQWVNWSGSATAPEDPARDGYEFTGWDKEFDRIVSYITVTAQYKQIVLPPQNNEGEGQSFLVQFFDAEGNLISEQNVELNGAAEAPAAPDKEGYEFAGWDSEFDNVTQNLVITALYNEIVENNDVLEDEPAVAAGPDKVFPWWWIVVGAGAVTLVLLIVFFAKRKKDTQQA